MPISSESTVAIAPAAKPTTSTPRVPTSNWLKMSRPSWSVPNQCAPEGAATGSVPARPGRTA